MKAPTPNEIRNAVKVLEAYRDQVHIEAAHSIIELPDTSLGVHYAGRIGSQTLEKSGRIDDIITRLNDWRESLRQKLGIRV
jgi:hypothetical protein